MKLIKNLKLLSLIFLIALIVTVSGNMSSVVEISDEISELSNETVNETTNSASDSASGSDDASAKLLISTEESNETNSDTVVIKLDNVNDIQKLNIDEKIISVYDNIDTVSIEVPNGTADDIIKKYADSPFVKDVYSDGEVRLFYTPSDPYYLTKQWNLAKINMQSAWNTSKGNSSIVVAILDTGVGPFADIDGIVNGADTSGLTIKEDTYHGQYTSENGTHGTAIASLIASNINSIGIAGIAPGVSIMPVKVFPSGSTTTGTTQIAAGIIWAVDHGADIINLSLGSNSDVSVLSDAVNYAISKDVLLVAATGNDSATDFIAYPAAYDGVVAVGSTGQSDAVSYFSNKGSAIDIAAPGEYIYLADFNTGAYSSMFGTSYSAPTVSAVAALVKSEYPDYNSSLIKQILYTGTEDVGTAGWDKSSGYGIINAAKVMDVAANPGLDSNDTIDTATEIAINKQYTGKNYPALDEDYYKFTMYESNTVSITATPTGLQDISLKLYNSSYSDIKTVNANLSGYAETLTYFLNQGVYYIKASDFWGNASNYDYNIKINSVDTTPPEVLLLQNNVPVDKGTISHTNLTLSVKDISYVDINILRNSVNYSIPADNVFTEDGVYEITVVDAAGNITKFNFTIVKNQLVIVNFDSQGGSALANKYVLEETVFSAPEMTTRSGYTFTGWYKEASCANLWDFNTDTAHSDIILYAGWSQNVSVKYRTHVQNVGWQSYVSNGETSGTAGQSLRLEGINIEISGDSNIDIKYTTHVQDYGWQSYVNGGVMSGTSGESKRLEAIKIELTGTDASQYNIYYRVHAQDYGWLDWAKDGEAAGTEGFSKRLEAIEVKIVMKTESVSFNTAQPFISLYGSSQISYRTHVQDYGWQDYVSDGIISGTQGQSKRLEGINIKLDTKMPSGSVVYSTHVQDYGWMTEVRDDNISGTVGQAKRLEAIRIYLSGEIANQYDLYYRVHAQNVGWMGWAKNGQNAGTAGYGYRLEGIQVILIKKGEASPGSIYNVFLQK